MCCSDAGVEPPPEAVVRLILPSIQEQAGFSTEAALEPSLQLGEARDSRPVMLSEALPVVPAWLVRKIKRAEFVQGQHRGR